MTVTLDSLVHQPGNTRDVTIKQMVDVVFNHSKPPAYSREEVIEIATAWARFTDEFGFPRSQTWGQGPGHETGWFWSRVEINQVHPDQNNWGGLGADNSGAAGASFGPADGFTAYEHGALAFMCHTALYVWGEPDRWPEHLQKYSKYAYRLASVRQAHNNLEKPGGQLLRHLGVVKRIGDFLNGRWAQTDRLPLGTLDNGYARGIVAKANEVRAMPVDSEEEPPVADLTTRLLDEISRQGIETHDIRDRLVTGGMYAWVGEGWEHVAVHYSAVWRERDTLAREIASWEGHARYHVNTHGWPGIAYALGLSQSGRVFGLRDAERMGFHAYNANGISIAICCDTTEGQQLTPELRRALNVTLRAMEKIMPRVTPERTWDHRGMQWYDARNASTHCAGGVIRPLIQGYRQGTDFGLNLPPQDVPIKPDHARVEVPGYGTFWIIENIYQAWAAVPNNITVFGYPISGMFAENGDKVQYFERACLRHKHDGYWPDNFDVDIEAIGRVAYQSRYGSAHAPAQPIPYFKDITERVWRPATRHSMSHGFLSFWRRRGDLKLFGEPITEEFLEDGVTVQYFERARFEWHPGSDPESWDVQLGRLGAEVYDERAAA